MSTVPRTISHFGTETGNFFYYFFFFPAEMTNVGGRCYRLRLRAKSNLPRGPWLQVETCWRVGSRLSGTSSRRCFLPLRMYQRWFFAQLFLHNLHRFSAAVDLSRTAAAAFLAFLFCADPSGERISPKINEAVVSYAAASGVWSESSEAFCAKNEMTRRLVIVPSCRSQNKQVQARPQ